MGHSSREGECSSGQNGLLQAMQGRASRTPGLKRSGTSVLPDDLTMNQLPIQLPAQQSASSVVVINAPEQVWVAEQKFPPM
jgi:hypothetical protein